VVENKQYLQSILETNCSYNNFEDFNKFQSSTYNSNRELSNLIGQFYNYKNFITDFDKLMSEIKMFENQLETNHQ
jgi:hypothetical protein